LTADISKAVDKLRENGTLAKIEDQWLAAGVDVPVLK
jgi:polar amino acid transport system substrate-binding protein